MTRSTNEHGFFTIWTMGLCIMLMAVGGMSLDLWRGFSERRELAAITDSAAIAAASQIDLAAFKANGSTKLDPTRAKQVALAYLNEQGAQANITYLNPPVVTVTDDEVNIEASTRIELTLMKFFRPNGDLNVTTRSSAIPEEVA